MYIECVYMTTTGTTQPPYLRDKHQQTMLNLVFSSSKTKDN